VKGSRLVRGPIVVLAAREPNPLPPVRTTSWHPKRLPPIPNYSKSKFRVRRQASACCGRVCQSDAAVAVAVAVCRPVVWSVIRR
jgi:hypothetical protein